MLAARYSVRCGEKNLAKNLLLYMDGSSSAVWQTTNSHFAKICFSEREGELCFCQFVETRIHSFIHRELNLH